MVKIKSSLNEMIKCSARTKLSLLAGLPKITVLAAYQKFLGPPAIDFTHDISLFKISVTAWARV